MSHVENTVQGLMAKAQEFASTWAVVDGPFDDGGAMQRANESKAQLEALIVDALHTSATSLKALHALILDGDLHDAARLCDQLLAQQEQMVAVEPWKDHRTAALVNDLRDCAKTYGNTQQLRERIATIVAPLCAQLKTAELAAAPQGVPVLYQFQDRDGKWCNFMHEEHYKNTVKDGSWPIRALYTHPTQQGLEQPIKWPKARDVGRFGDMSPDGSIRVGLDADNDVYVSICDGTSVADIEFCTPGGGGGRSSRTRMALIALMCAIEADNASHPAFDFWQRNLAAQAKQGGAA